jgi:toxin ParE1/3/4
MPIKKILISNQAMLDMEDIWYYIAEDNIVAADALYALFEKKFRILSETPRIGRARPEISENILSFPVGNYIVFYKVGADVILIARVISGKRDLPALFDED